MGLRRHWEIVYMFRKEMPKIIIEKGKYKFLHTEGIKKAEADQLM